MQEVAAHEQARAVADNQGLLAGSLQVRDTFAVAGEYELGGTMSNRDERFAFWSEDIVRLLQDHPHVRLKAGDQGYVWGLYDPQWYDAEFYRDDGSSVSMMFEENEVELVSDTRDVQIPKDALELWQHVIAHRAEPE